MSDLLTQLAVRFGAENIELIEPKSDGEYPLALITTGSDRKVQILSTVGLSSYTMPIDEKHEDRTHVELYFCLPSYWDIKDETNPNFNWVFHWIQRLTNYVVNNKTWFAHGHTIPAGNPPTQLSETMKQSYFMFANPIALVKELNPVELEPHTVYFLAIIPLFSDEFEHKIARSTLSLIQKLEAKNYTEILDDYRSSCVRKKYILF